MYPHLRGGITYLSKFTFDGVFEQLSLSAVQKHHQIKILTNLVSRHEISGFKFFSLKKTDKKLTKTLLSFFFTT